MKLLVPSRGRAKLLAQHSPFVEAAHVVVDEVEVDSYAAAFSRVGRRPAELVAIAGAPTVAEIRNQALDAAWTPDVDGCFFLDDDTSCIANVCAQHEEILDVDRAVQALSRTCAAASEAGTGVCGIGTSAKCSAFVPVSVIADLYGSALGVVDPDLRFDPRAVGVDDIELCLQGIKRYGFVWRDNRYRHRPMASQQTRRVAGEELYGIDHVNAKYRGETGGNVLDAMPHARSARRTAAWRYVRAVALRRARDRCEQCGCSGVELDCHHMVPLRHGGEAFSLRNVRILCEGCHAAISERFATFEKKRDVRGRWIPNERNTAWRRLRGDTSPERLSLRINFAEIGAVGP